MNIQSTHATSAVATLTHVEDPSGPCVTPSSLLPEPSPMLLGADIGAEIAALAVKTGETQRDIETRAAETEDTVEDRAEQAEVSTMHDEASTMRAGAWTSGLLQVGAGVCSIASAGMSIDAAHASQGPAACPTASPGGSVAVSQAVSAAGVAGMLKGFSEGLNGGGTLAGGLSKAAATDCEALATASKALADAAERSGAAARDGQKNASDFVQSAIDFYREYESTKAQADAAAVHGA
jgi:hypothetical protein